jgi:hypothetical protein
MTLDADRKPTKVNATADEAESNRFRLDTNNEVESIDWEQSEDMATSSPERAVSSVSIEELADRDTGFGRILHRLRDESAEGLAPTGGDLDADQYQSKVSGEEAVGGSSPTPDQNVVDDLAESEGIETRDEHPLRTLRMMQERDAHRWELEPDSSEDYKEHSL